MHFAARALTGLALAALTLVLILLGGAPFLACAPGFDSVMGRACVFDPKPRDGARARRANAPPAPAVIVTTIGVETVALQSRALGTLREGRSIELRAGASGRVVALGDAVEDGAIVMAGALLFRIDPSELEAGVADAAAALAEAKAEAAEAVRSLRFAEAELQAAIEQRGLREKGLSRQTGLEQRGFSTEAALEEARLQLAEAERAVITRDSARVAAEKRVEQSDLSEDRAEIVLREARRSLTDAETRAPFAGLLEQPAAELGRLVNQNESMGALLDLTSMEVAFRVPDRVFGRFLDDAGRLKALPIQVTLPLGERRIEGQGVLARIGARSAPGEGGRLVYATLSLETETVFRPGDLVDVLIDEPPIDRATRLPSRAVALRRLSSDDATSADGASSQEAATGEVWLVNAEDTLERVPVRVLRREGDDVWVSTLDRAAFGHGARVVIDRSPALTQGARVRAVEQGASGATPAPTADAAADSRG